MAKILLVEDDKSLREIYGVRLLAEGYDIVTAGDGEEALAMAIKERPQLILSDVMMPKISGFDMLDILRSTTETKDIKVIMMTALSSEDQRRRGEQLGADRYLVKSQVGIEDVVRTVHDVLGDIPKAAPTPQQTFGVPGPSAIPRQPAGTTPPPAPAESPTPPAPQVAPPAAVQQPMPSTTAPTMPPQPPQAQAPAPAAVPPRPTTPAPSPQNVTTPNTTDMPRPTAPFSSQRPASLGERVIQPLEQPQVSNENISNRIEQELAGGPGAADLSQDNGSTPQIPQ